MQRLFSMFPGGPPGLGLLILRLTLAWLIVTHVPEVEAHRWQNSLIFASVAAAAALAFGLLTPVIGLLGAVAGVVSLVVGDHGEATAMFVFIALMMSLALTGPGAYSLDAKLYGRREVLLAREGASRD